MIFIVSTGRSGSTGIAHALGTLEGCNAVHEPAPELILEASGYLRGTVPRAELERILLATRREDPDGDVYCESNQNLSLIIPLLAELYPEARFVWLIRNGMDTVASAYQKQWYTGHSENHDTYAACSDIEKAWIDGRIRADWTGEMTEPEWDACPRFEKCCWYWDFVNRRIERDLADHAPGRNIRIRLEEFNLRIGELVRWLGFETAPVPDVPVSNPARKPPHHWTAWSREEFDRFEVRCGALMDRHYPGWKEFVHENNVSIFVTPAIQACAQQVVSLNARAAEREAAQRKRIDSLVDKVASLRRELDKEEKLLRVAKARQAWNEGHWSYRWYLAFRHLLNPRKRLPGDE